MGSIPNSPTVQFDPVPTRSQVQPRSGQHQYACALTHRANKRNATLTLSELRKFKKERAETRKRMESINKNESNMWCKLDKVRD